MKVHYVPLLFLLCLTSSTISYGGSRSPDSIECKKILDFAEQTAHKFIPDKRMAIFEITRTPHQANPSYSLSTTEPDALEYFTQLLDKHRVPRKKVTVHLLPDRLAGQPIHGIVNLSVANLRVSPSNQAEMATQVLLGTQLDLLQYDDGYYRVRTPEGYIAWVSASSVTPKSESALTRWQRSDKVIVTADFTHAYTLPNAQSLRVSDLVMGNILSVVDSVDNFIQVRYPDGRTGYVEPHQVQPFTTWLGTRQLKAENILKTAKSMMGIPYLWGGTSVKGVDCSGFTKTAFYMNGLIIPRDASQQVLAGRPIDVLSGGVFNVEKALQNLEPGDLLFFASGTGRPADAHVTHVALYLGKGEFIHAAGFVHINSFLREAPNYGALDTRTLVAARRYIGQTDPMLQSLEEHPYYKLTN